MDIGGDCAGNESLPFYVRFSLSSVVFASSWLSLSFSRSDADEISIREPLLSSNSDLKADIPLSRLKP